MQADTSVPLPGLQPILADASVQLREEESEPQAGSVEKNKDPVLDHRGMRPPSVWNVEDVVEEWEELQTRIRKDLSAQERLMKLLIQRRRDDEHLSARRADDVAGQKVVQSQPSELQSTGMSSQSDPVKIDRIDSKPKQPTKKEDEAWDRRMKCDVKETFCDKKAHAMVSLHAHRSSKSLDSSGWRHYLKNRFYDVVEWWLFELTEPKRVGRLARFVDSGSFEAVSISMVLLNVLFTVRQQNSSLQDIGGQLPGTFAVVDWMFTSFFLLELSLKLVVHRLYFFVNEEASWNVTDFLVVVMTTWQLILSSIGTNGMELGFLRSFRILKLARILRLVRMIKIFDDLRIIVAAFINSVQALAWCLVLLFLTIGIFALLFVQLVGDFLAENKDTACTSPADECINNMLMYHFGSVQQSILTLYMATTGGNDWALYYDMLSKTGESAAAIFIFYTAFYYFGMFNLLTGMFVDKAVRASKPDADAMHLAARKMEEDFVEGFLAIFEEFDHDGDKLIDRSEFEEVMYDDKAKAYMLGMSLDFGAMRVVFDSLEAVSPKVQTKEFIRGCCRMRGEAKSMDLHSLRYEVQALREHLESALAVIDRRQVASLSLGRQYLRAGDMSDGEEVQI